MDPLLGGIDELLGIGSTKNKMLKCDETSFSKGRYGVEAVDCAASDLWKVTVFLTPPSSPPHAGVPTTCHETGTADETREHHRLLASHDSLAEDDDVFKPRSTKDLKSMLIRDCMWNGFTLGETNKTGNGFEKLRSLTKTPPLVDCNLFITYVDPSEIWPFGLTEQVKGGNRLGQDETKANVGECPDEDVEVDVVSLEVNQNVQEKKEETPCEDSNEYNSAKCEKDTELCSQGRAFPLTPSASDDEYSCKLRSGLKERECDDSENCKDNDGIDQRLMQRVSSGDESDQDCELGRATHNVLERKRRNELKQRFQYLRDSIPELADNDRAPKVAVLQKAFAYITHLKMEEKTLIDESLKHRNSNAQLRKRVLDLQSKALH